MLACEGCNQTKGKQDIRLFLADKPGVLARVLAQAKAPLKDAAVVNTTRWALAIATREERHMRRRLPPIPPEKECAIPPLLNKTGHPSAVLVVVRIPIPAGMLHHEKGSIIMTVRARTQHDMGGSLIYHVSPSANSFAARGRMALASPSRPRSARAKMGALRSGLMAMTVWASRIPLVC